MALPSQFVYIYSIAADIIAEVGHSNVKIEFVSDISLTLSHPMTPYGVMVSISLWVFI